MVSGGSINISSMGDTDGWVTGTFTVEPARKHDVSLVKQVGLVSIEGRFRVRRAWGW